MIFEHLTSPVLNPQENNKRARDSSQPGGCSERDTLLVWC